MNVIVCILFFMLAGASAPSLAGPAQVLRVNEPARSVPAGVGGASPMTRYDGRPHEQALSASMASRRLTRAELDQLREQVRQQWPMRKEANRLAQSQPVGRAVPSALPGSDLMSESGAPRP